MLPRPATGRYSSRAVLIFTSVSTAVFNFSLTLKLMEKTMKIKLYYLGFILHKQKEKVLIKITIVFLVELCFLPSVFQHRRHVFMCSNFCHNGNWFKFTPAKHAWNIEQYPGSSLLLQFFTKKKISVSTIYLLRSQVLYSGSEGKKIKQEWKSVYIRSPIYNYKMYLQYIQNSPLLLLF